MKTRVTKDDHYFYVIDYPLGGEEIVLSDKEYRRINRAYEEISEVQELIRDKIKKASFVQG